MILNDSDRKPTMLVETTKPYGEPEPRKREMTTEQFVKGVSREWPELLKKHERYMHPGRRLEVHKRAGRRCAHVDENGERCGERDFLQIHHIRERAQGGAHELTNLVTLCWRHHQERHPTHRVSKFVSYGST